MSRIKKIKVKIAQLKAAKRKRYSQFRYWEKLEIKSRDKKDDCRKRIYDMDSELDELELRLRFP